MISFYVQSSTIEACILKYIHSKTSVHHIKNPAK